jgi:DNA polymerase-3 subunit beta
MKVICNRGVLSDFWSVAQGVVPSRPTRPILANIKISASKTGVELQASDMDIGIRLQVGGAEVIEEGSAVIPAALFGSILRDSWADKVELSTEENLVHVTMQTSRFKIHGDDPEHFPEQPTFNEDNMFSVPKASFLQMVRLTSFATAQEDTRYALNGVLLSVKGKNAGMVATDGRRLAYAKCKISTAAKKDVSAIVHVKGLQEIERSLREDDDAVHIAVDDNRLFAKSKTATVFTKLIEGTFPNYEEVIPTDADKKVNIKREELLAGLRQSAKMTSEESRAVRLLLENDKLTLSSSSPEAGDAIIEVPAQYGGEAFEIRFNPSFLTDALKAIAVEEVSMEVKERSSPGIIRVGKDFAYVVMPINIE